MTTTPPDPDPTTPPPDPGGPVEKRTLADLQAMHAQGYRLDVTDGYSVPASWRFLLRDEVRAAWEADFHKNANMQALISWYEAGADGQIDWKAPDAPTQALKVATPHFPEPIDAALFVDALIGSMAGTPAPL